MGDLNETIAGLTIEQRKRLEERLQKRKRPSHIPGITRRSDTESGPLSFAQQRMWFLNQLEPQSDAYHIDSVYRLTGRLDHSALEQSLRAIVQRHEALRTVFIAHEGVPQQAIVHEPDISLPLVDLTHLPNTEREAAAMEQIAIQRKKPFDLARDLKIRALLLRIDTNVHILAVVTHHIASDAWSMGIFRRELSQAYRAFTGGRTPMFAPLPVRYEDYAAWQHEWPQGERLEKQLSYWRSQLNGIKPLDLPTDYSRPAIQSDRGGAYTFLLPPGLLDSLHRFSRHAGVSFFMLMQAALCCLLQRYSGQDDIAVGTVIANRRRSEIEGLIGFFQNTLVLRADLAGDPTFAELLARVHHVTMDAYSHQDIPFEKLLAELQPERDLGHSPFFRVLLSLDNTPAAALELAGLNAEAVQFNHQTSKMDLSFYLSETDAGLEIHLEYSSDLFEPDTIRRMAAHYQELLIGIVNNPDMPISHLAMLPLSERKLLLETWNQSAEDFRNLPDLISQFYAQVAENPDGVAFFDGAKSITIAELNDRSNRLAHYLLAQGIAAGTKIGLCLERSVDVPAALLAIFKVGGVYVPLDPSYPEERLRFILEDSDVSALITHTQWLPKLILKKEEVTNLTLLCLDDLQDGLAQQPIEDVRPTLTADQTAYIIYTSGSTGWPKGVTVPHRQILNRLAWMWQHYPFHVGEVGCQKTALNFVDSLWELLGYLLQGVPTVVIPDDVVRDPRRFVDTLAASGVTRLWLVPSLLRVILDTHHNLQELLPNLRFWVSSGEALTTTLYVRFRKIMPGSTLYNLYGTSELWDVAWFDPEASPIKWHGLSVPIGRPISNMRVVILEENGQPAPIGVTGELCVGGDGLADGYLNRPELTNKKFTFPTWIDHQEANEDTPPNSVIWQSKDRIYHTGDRARWLANGQIEFMGRVDAQVKLRGHRIELGEIETHLDDHPAVRQSVVIVDQSGTNRERLIAYYVAHDYPAPEARELSQFVRTYLPLSMIPSFFLPLPALPQTPSGKLDRQSLPAPDKDAAFLSDDYTAPVTLIEQELAAVWADVLQLPRIGIHDSFFDAGGHSLLGIRLFALIEERLGKRLPLSLLFTSPTIAQMAAALESGGLDGDAVLVPMQPEGSKPPLFTTHGVFGDNLAFNKVLNTLDPEQPVYGLQAIGLAPGQGPDETIEAMASRYIEAMQQVQPSGPYHLAGYCYGGVIAYEMACQLEEMGEEVALLAIIEGLAPLTYREDVPLYHPRRLRAVIRAAPLWLSGNKAYGGWRVRERARAKLGSGREKSPNLELRAILDEENTNFDDVYAERPEIQYQLREHHIKIHGQYEPQRYGGQVLLIKASAARAGQLLFGPFDPLGGWQNLAEGGVDLRYIGGTHFTIMQGENASDLADLLSSALNYANRA